MRDTFEITAAAEVKTSFVQVVCQSVSHERRVRVLNMSPYFYLNYTFNIQMPLIQAIR